MAGQLRRIDARVHGANQVWPSLSAARTRLPLCTVLVLAVLSGGCFARIDHLHDPAKLETAKSGEAKLQAFVDDRKGVNKTLLDNLNARKQLEQLVADAQIRVFDNELAMLSTDVSWLRLRARLLQDLGMLRGPENAITLQNVTRYVDASDPAIPDADLRVATNHGDEAFAQRIGDRQKQIAAALTVLEFIHASQEELRSYAAEAVAKAEKERDF
jgi:hypothetical protein